MPRINANSDNLLTRLFLQLTAVNILFNLIQPINNFIDSMLTGSELGLDALENYALFLPLAALVVALSMVFSIGTQVNCSHKLGKGDSEDVKALIKTSFLSSIVFSIIFTIILLVFAEQVSVLLGASSDISGQVYNTAMYIRGYAIGVPAIFLMNIMMSLLQIEGKKNLVIILSVTNLVINLLGDILNIYVLKMGLFGMALATSVANIIVCLILLVYFLVFSKMFKFSLLGFQGRYLYMIIRDGFPSFTYFGSIVIRTFLFNYIIINYLDVSVLAVMAVINNFAGVVDALMTGFGDTTLLIGGVLYGEKDNKGMSRMMKIALISSVVLMFVVTVISIVASGPIVSLFSDSNEPVFLENAARAISISAFYFVPDVIALVFKKQIQAVGRRTYTSVSNVLCNVVYVGVFAFIFVKLLGSDGLFLSFTLCYTAILITHLVYANIIASKNNRRGFDKLLFLPQNYDIEDKDIWKKAVNNREACLLSSKEIGQECLERNIDKKRANYVKLVIEEVSLNVIEHGFVHGKNNTIIIRVIFLSDSIIVSIKDDCPHFNPKNYYDIVCKNDDVSNNIGIHLVMQLAKKVVYTNSFDMNNLMVEM